MKIAVITSSYPRFDGDITAPFIKSICDNLFALGHEVDVIAPYDPEVRTIREKGVQVHWFKYVWPKKLHIMGHGNALYNDTNLKTLTFILLPLFLFPLPHLPPSPHAGGRPANDQHR